MKNLMKSVMAIGLATVAMTGRADECTFEPLDITAEKGSIVELPVSMTNNDVKITSLQFDLYLPEGVTPVFNADEVPIITMDPSRTADHIVNAAVQENGCVRYVSYSLNNRLYKGTEGVLLTVSLQVNAEPGQYEITIRDVELCTEELVPTFPVEATSTLTVTTPEVKRYGDNQLYAKDVTINQGENATLLVGYNSQSDVYEYAADIVLPEGVTATAVAFESMVTDVTNYENTWSFDAPTLKLSGEYGGGRKDQPAEGGDKLFATVTLNTSSLAAGEYLIKVQNQKLFNDDDLYPEAYDAILTVVGGAVVPTEQCATPEISIDNNGNIVATCETTGAKLHTTITVDDHKTVHHDSGETVELSGQYHVTSYATADGMEDSEPATATLAWAKNYTDPTGVQEVGTERALLIYSVGDYLVIKGTIEDEPVAVYDLGGTILYGGKATANTFMVPDPLTKGTVYIITIGGRNIKHVL